MKLSKAEMSQFKALSGLVDAIAAAKEPAPSDVKLSVQNHFIRLATNVFVPYVLEIEGGQFTSFPVALYSEPSERARWLLRRRPRSRTSTSPMQIASSTRARIPFS